MEGQFTRALSVGVCVRVCVFVYVCVFVGERRERVPRSGRIFIRSNDPDQLYVHIYLLLGG